jgi:CTP:molybdopterin cytidylyltransferase MocA
VVNRTGDLIFAILLASGFSRRFGEENKLLFPFQGKSMARHTLDMVRSAEVWSGIFFVCADDRVAALAAGVPGGPPFELIRNAAPEKGRRESVRLGVKAALRRAAAVRLEAGGLMTGAVFPSGTSYPPSMTPPLSAADGDMYYAFFPCDQPFLDMATVARILEARRPGFIVEPRFRGAPGNPCVFSDFFRDELLTLGEGETPKHIKARHPDHILPVELPSGLPLKDIDSREDVENTEFIRH